MASLKTSIAFALAALGVAINVGSGVVHAQAVKATEAKAQGGSLLPLAQPLWPELSPVQQSTLAPFANQWNSLPVSEKKAWVKLADEVPKMTAPQQVKARQRIKDWANLTPAERKLARDNYRLAKAVPQNQQAEEYKSYRSMTTEQRRVLRTAGVTSNTAAGHAGAPTGLAKEAAQPIPVAPKGPAAMSKAPAPTPIEPGK